MDASSLEAMSVAPQATMHATAVFGSVHVVSFEDCGDCTLRELARSTVSGDDVLVLGPEVFARRLVEFGLSRDVGLHRVGRCAGRWRQAEIAKALQKLGGGSRGNRATVLHGCVARASRASCDAHAGELLVAHPVAGNEFTRVAGIPEVLPELAPAPENRRARLRRELGLAPFDIAILLTNEPASWVDLGLVARAIGMAHVALVGSGVRLRLIASPATPRVLERSRFLCDAVSAPEIILDARAERPWELLAAVDALLVDQDGLVTDPVSCAGDRCPASLAAGPMTPSPRPALWGLAAERPTFVHASISLGVHESGPRASLIHRFADDVAALSRAFHDFARGFGHAFSHGFGHGFGHGFVENVSKSRSAASR
jgi:hypothetical protein